MLDPAGLAPTAVPRPEILDALRVDPDRERRVVLIPVTELYGDDTDGPGLRAERNELGGFHIGRRTLVRVDGGAALTWERFAADYAGLGRIELRQIFAALGVSGMFRRFEADRWLTVSVVPAVTAPDPSPPRVAADAELARLDALVCQLGEARRRYTADTACNAWSLEQAARDVARAAEAAAKAFAVRSELA